MIGPVEAGAEDGRINNVDVGSSATGCRLRLRGGRTVDVAVASDRALDVIRFYRIDKDARANPLVEITDPRGGRAFPTRPRADGTGKERNPVPNQNTAYGLGLWKEPATGRLLAAVTQRGQARIDLFLLEPRADRRVAARYIPATSASAWPTTGRTCGRTTRRTRAGTGARGSRGS